ncbi:MAG: lipocalin-like domain-containing protein [Bacteroidota bacterium]
MNWVKYWCILLSSLVLSCAKREKTERNPLLGSWAIEKVEWISNDTIVSRIPAQKGIFLVTPDRYSICWTPLERERTPFQNLSNPTENEVLEGFGSIVFNTGGYINSDSTIITMAHMAKVPGFEGGKQFYHYQRTGNRLTLKLFDETYPDGKKPDWLGTWQTQFSLVRISNSATD